MIKAAIVDDEAECRQALAAMLEKYCPEVKLTGQYEDADAFAKSLHLAHPDLVFMDISLPGKSGLQYFQEMPEILFEVIFVTAHQEHVLQAMRLSAVDYLLKPVMTAELIASVASAIKRLTGKEGKKHLEVLLHNLNDKVRQVTKKMCIPVMQGFQVIDLNEILYAEAENSYTILHLSGKRKIVSTRTLLEYENLLADTNFLRIHRSFLINPDYITSYQKGDGGIVTMSNGIEIEVSRRKKDYFLEKVGHIFRLM